MHTFLLICALCIIGETEGQNCTLPSNWHNKVFRDGINGFWRFSESGTAFSQQTPNAMTNYECFQIVGRFLIVKVQDMLGCFTIEITNADSFTAIYGAQEISISDFTNECDVCSSPASLLLQLSALDTVAQNQTGPECNIPEGCTPSSTAVDPILCEDNGNIEGEFNDVTTAPPPPPPPPKHCKHSGP